MLKRISIGPVSKIFLALFLCPFLILFAHVSFARQSVPLSHSPVRPVISNSYVNDRDHDRIDDELFRREQKARDREQTAITPSDRIRAQDDLGAMVDVELIFTEQITQQQIDRFVASGGRIDHVYQAVSYGWNGRIPLGKVRQLTALMGSSLVLIDEPKKAELHMRIATQTGRVRPVWANGFAGSAGYDGDSTITIAIIDTGVDDSHTDLSGRNVFWHDYSSDGEVSPRDIIQHGSHVAGIALGTGASLGTGTTLLYTDSGSLSGVPTNNFYPSVIDFPQVAMNWNSTATWLGGGQTTLYHAYKTKGTTNWFGIKSASNVSGVSLNTALNPALSSRAYSNALISNGHMTTYAIANSMTNYSVVGDGFNTLRGVAPGSNWIGAKVFLNSGYGATTWTGAAIDDMVLMRTVYNIKVMNLSIGTLGDPGIDVSTRQKINNAALNGILAVISAGNDGPGNTSFSEVDDPGRAAMALTIGASNDINQLTDYTSSGFISPGSTPGQEEDYKPDILAPGGSVYYSMIMSVDSNDADGGNSSYADVRNNDYYNIMGTSMAAPFAAGSAALVIDALQSTGGLTGASWDFSSSNDVRLVKMLLCATATETNAGREAGTGFNPTLQRASAGPEGFPVSKDRYEGYGMINADAAIEGGTVYYAIGNVESGTLGGSDASRRAWARRVTLTAGQMVDFLLTVPGTGDFDLYLYSMAPGAYGTPVILASSTTSGSGTGESIVHYTTASSGDTLIVVKRISGQGQFTFSSSLISYTLDITKLGSGSGGVMSSPAGIDCGIDCSQDYAFGTEVTLTATPDTGSAFTGWSGDTDCDDGIVVMNAHQTCAAGFSLLNYTLNVNSTGTGTGTVTSSPLGIDCGADCSQDYPYGTGVMLTATPDPESVFTGWSGNADCLDGTVTVDSAKTCTAVFDKVQYVLTTSVTPPGNGSITPDCSSGCLYDSGTIVVFTANEDNGYPFVSWTGCDSPSSGICSMTINGNKSLTAAFDPCRYPVRIPGSPTVYFSTLQDAYDLAIDGETLQGRDVVFADDLTANRNISVTIDGGYNCDYSAVAGKTTFNGLMTVSDGVVTIGDYIFGN